MGKNIGFKSLLVLVLLLGQSWLISPARAQWTIVSSPSISSNWELLNLSFPYAAGQDLANQTGVLLQFSHGTWRSLALPTVSSNWGLSDMAYSSNGEAWAVGQDVANGTGTLLLFSNGSWTSVEPPGVSTDWGLSALTFISPDGGWMVGQDFENKKGVILSFATVAVTPPTLTTTPVSEITATSAMSGGTIDSDGGASVTARGVCWDTTANPVVGSNCTQDGTGTGTFTSTIAGLLAGTQYHVRAYATNDAGTGYGNDVVFTTLSASSLPSLTTIPPTIVNITTISTGGTILSDGGFSLTAWGVCVSTALNPAVGGNCTNDGTGTPPQAFPFVFQSTISSLTPDTLYHIRAYATNSVGTGYGDDLTITIPSSTSVLQAVMSTEISAADTTPTPVRPVLVVKAVPDVSSDWGLSGVSLAWAVGRDNANTKGVMLHLVNPTWIAVEPPEVSADWGLTSVDMISSREGWAAGRDNVNKTGVLLHFKNSSWTSVQPPDVSGDWGLSNIDVISSSEAWAAGQDLENGKGVLLHFIGGSWTPVDLPDISSNWGLSAVDVISSHLGWAVGKTSDGQNVTGLILQYASPQLSLSPASIDYGSVDIGTPSDKAVVVRNVGNGSLDIGTITFPSSPFSIKTDDCSGKTLIPLQTCRVTYRFLPDSEGSFSDSSVISSNTDTLAVTFLGAGIAGAEPVTNPVLSHTSKTAQPPPTLSWENNGNMRFKAWFGNGADFQQRGVKKVVLSFKTQDPNANQGVFTVGLTSSQWASIRKLGGDVTGAVLYWYVESSDPAGRKAKSGVKSFTLTD